MPLGCIAPNDQDPVMMWVPQHYENVINKCIND